MVDINNMTPVLASPYYFDLSSSLLFEDVLTSIQLLRSLLRYNSEALNPISLSPILAIALELA